MTTARLRLSLMQVQCYSARTRSVERRSLLRAHVPRTLLETMAHGGDGSQAREGRAKRRHCARHGEHRPGARGPRDRRDVWDRKTPRFRSGSARPRSGARAGRTIARPAPSPRSVRTRLTARDRQTSQAGPPPEKTITLASLVAPAWYVASPRIRRVVGSTCAARRDRLPDPSRNPRPTRTHARPPRHFPRRIHPNAPRVACVARRTFPARPPRPREPLSNFTCRCCAVRLSLSSSSSSARSTAPISARLPAISVCSATRVRRAVFAARGSLPPPRAPTLHPRDARPSLPLRSLSSGPPR